MRYVLHLEGTLNKLECLKTVDGSALKAMKGDICIENNQAELNGEKMTYKFSMDSEFQSVREEYLKSMKKNIKSRLGKTGADILNDFGKLLEPTKMNEVSTEETLEAVSHLATFYGSDKTVKRVYGDLIEGTEEEEEVVSALLDPEQLQQEWPRLEGMIKGSYKSLTVKNLCKRVILLNKNTMPNLTKLAIIALCMQLTSVDCERSFSLQNRLKSKFRSSLGAEKLDILLTIRMLGPPVASVDLKPAIIDWLKKKRRKARLFLDYQPRTKKQKTC